MTNVSPRALRAQRRELKFLVEESLARRVRAGVAPYVEPDPFAARFEGNTYPIASLYLDGSELPLYRETVEGLRDRFKLRVRTYSDDADGVCFFEIKRRRDGIVEKTRAAVLRPAAEGLLADPAAVDAIHDPRTHRALLEFFSLAAVTAAQPRTVVRYDREAWVGRFDPEIRVTFDRHLQAAVTDEGRLRVARPDYVPVEGRRVVVEFKFNRCMSTWMAKVIQALELTRVSYSKYGHSIEACATHGAFRRN